MKVKNPIRTGFNWKLVAHPLKTLQIDMTNNSPSSGVWAPDLTFRNGMFYIVFSNVETFSKGPIKDCYNYLISSPLYKRTME